MITSIYILYNWPSSSGGKDFKFRECILAILLLSPVVKRCGLSIWTNLNPLNPGMPFCQVWLKLAQWFYTRRFLKFFLFRNYLPLEKDGALHLNNFTKGYFVLSIVEIGRLRFWRRFSSMSMYFHYIVIISPWKRAALALYMNKLDSPSAWDDICHVWLKLAQWFWRWRFLKFIDVF